MTILSGKPGGKVKGVEHVESAEGDGPVNALDSALRKALVKTYPVIEEIRGLGLMRALKLSVLAAPYADEARAQGLLINATQGDVLRIMPPMTVTPKEIRQGMKILDKVFQTAQQKPSEGASCSNH